MNINCTGTKPPYKHESDAGADVRAAESLEDSDRGKNGYGSTGVR